MIHVRNVRTTSLIAELHNSGRSITLMEPYTVVCKDRVWIIPAGFQTDFASIPRWLWWLIPPWGRYFPAAVVHDWEYSTASESKRADADRYFFEIMTEIGIPFWRRYPMYWAVRLFGQKAWRSRNVSI